jgi:glycosyltransferase involved in cell wall biosynthesis
MGLFNLPGRLAAVPARLLAAGRYRRDLASGRAAGSLSHRFVEWKRPDAPLVELRLRVDGGSAVARDEAEDWCRRQTLAELRAVGFDINGAEVWRVDPTDEALATVEASFFAAPGRLPEAQPSQLESALMVAAAEAVDAVVLRIDRAAFTFQPPIEADAVHTPELRPWALYRSDAYRWLPALDAVRPSHNRRLVKVIDSRGATELPREVELFNARRRGPYLSDADLGPMLRIQIRDASLLERRPAGDNRPAVLVTAPFLARGGAEQTLHATLSALSRSFRFSIATLAPHRPALGDRRRDFLDITNRIFCLGDLVHPDAMPGMLLALLEGEGAEVLYNANGTTLFYDFAPVLKSARPGLRIVDHLYDHEVGYIERYQPGLKASVDLCIAENRPIAEVLVNKRGWPAERVPVIWPCGRPQDALPPESHRPRLRRSIRHELGFVDDDVVILTAARMHPQKRPLDLVALAERVRDLDSLHFLLVGGGDLEGEVDHAIAAATGARIRRLAFRSDIPDLIVAADVGCLVSDHEGLPVFLLECLQLGRPFLGTRVGDLATVLDETGAGLVVDRPGDLDGLETAVRHLADSAIRAELAARAVAAAPRFSVAACAEAYAQAFLGGD